MTLYGFTSKVLLDSKEVFGDDETPGVKEQNLYPAYWRSDMPMRLATDPKDERDLLRALVLFACWRWCSACGSTVLYVDSACGSKGQFVCGICYGRASSVPENDNGEIVQ
jgi:hypothetical protein